MISVIIPVHNEATYLNTLLPFLKANGGNLLTEIIVADAQSTDHTAEVCSKHEVKRLTCETKRRAVQMNIGAAAAGGNILYFVHADTVPPTAFAEKICEVFKNGTTIARYRAQFQSPSLLLKMNAFFTRFDIFMCYGGDNTLAITKNIFTDINGFDESLAIMEDYDITERARQKGMYKIMPGCVKVSARKYDTNSWLAVQRANYKAVKMYRKGVETPIIAEVYKKSLNH